MSTWYEGGGGGGGGRADTGRTAARGRAPHRASPPAASRALCPAQAPPRAPTCARAAPLSARARARRAPPRGAARACARAPCWEAAAERQAAAPRGGAGRLTARTAARVGASSAQQGGAGAPRAPSLRRSGAAAPTRVLRGAAAVRDLIGPPLRPRPCEAGRGAAGCGRGRYHERRRRPARLPRRSRPGLWRCRAPLLQATSQPGGRSAAGQGLEGATPWRPRRPRRPASAAPRSVASAACSHPPAPARSAKKKPPTPRSSQPPPTAAQPRCPWHRPARAAAAQEPSRRAHPVLSRSLLAVEVLGRSVPVQPVDQLFGCSVGVPPIVDLPPDQHRFSPESLGSASPWGTASGRDGPSA